MRYLSFGLLAGLLLIASATSLPAASFDRKVVEGVTVIGVSGQLELGDQTKFAAIAVGAGRALVVLSSPGGNLIAGIEIGKLIRMRNFTTMVAGGDECSSACALAWLGGTKRLMFEGSLIGFHAAYSTESGRIEVTSVGNALVGAYLTNLGLPEAAVVHITSAPPYELTWLEPHEAGQLGIEVTTTTLLVPRATSTPAWAVLGKPEAGQVGPGEKRSPTSAWSVPPASGLEARATTFMRTHWARVSSSNEAYLVYAQRVYAEVVDYYGTSTGRDEILRQQQAYVARWPERTNRPVPGSETTTCGRQHALCTVQGTGEFTAVSKERRKQSSGFFSYSFTLSLTGDQPRIVAENSTVTARHQRDLTP
jgi:hypothetical protein